MRYGIMCSMAPRNPGDERLVRMHGPTFDTAEKRDKEMDVLRRQNLSFRMRSVDLPDYDAPAVGDGTPDAALAIAEHAFRTGHKAGRKLVADINQLGYEASGEPDDFAVAEHIAWSDYDPPEEIKALS